MYQIPLNDMMAFAMRRRNFLQGSLLAASALNAQIRPRKKIAAIAESYLIHSTADLIVSRFLEGYWINDDFYKPPYDVASLYIDRMPAADVGARVSTAYGLPLAKSIDALRLGPDGVLILGDDDNFDFFTKVVDAFAKTGRSVPVLCAGALSSNWDHARQMYRQSQQMGFPLMAGSSEAVTFRRPEIDYPLPSAFDDAPLGDRAHHDDKLGVSFDHALVIVPGGASIFPGIEILQSFLERRRGGESGIRSVECLKDEAVWQAAEQGLWSRELMDAALGRRQSAEHPVEHPTVWLVDYNDGTRGALLSLGNLISDWLAAFRLTGRKEIDTTLCYIPVESRNDVNMLVHAITQMIVSGKAPYPVERNLLASGALFFLLDSERQRKRIETPTLDIKYTAPRHSFYAQGSGW